MKTLLIIDANLGQARAYMAKTLLGAAAQKAHLEIIDNPNDAELAIVLGDTLPADSSLNGKKSGWATLVVRLRTLNCSSAKRRAMQNLTVPRLQQHLWPAVVQNAWWQ